MDELMEFFKNHPPATDFFPCVYYNKDGNQIEVFWDNASCYGKELKGRDGKSIGCLMLDQDTDQPVGITIYSIKQLLRSANVQEE